MASSSVKVCVRVRPFNSVERGEGMPCVVAMEGKQTRLVDPTCYENGGPPPSSEEIAKAWSRTFTFDESLWSHAKADASSGSVKFRRQ